MRTSTLYNVALALFLVAVQCAPTELAPNTTLLPFVRTIVDFMDNCSGTNKSQFMFGALSLLVLRCVVDAVMPFFMVPGHTKFDSDSLAQLTAGVYNKGDCFNLGMLNEMFANFAAVKVFDGATLADYHDMTPNLFAAVEKINSFRAFMMVGDDGSLEADLNRVAEPPGFTNYYDGAVFYTEESLKAGVHNLKKRSLVKIIRLSNQDGSGFRGIGTNAAFDGPGSTGSVLGDYRHVRLFVKLTEQSGPWCEQLNYHLPRMRDAAKITTVLKTLLFFKDLPDDRITATKIYGKMLDQLVEQYYNYVPVQYVPLSYAVATEGRGGMNLSTVVRDLIYSEADCIASETAEANAAAAKAAKAAAKVAGKAAAVDAKAAAAASNAAMAAAAAAAASPADHAPPALASPADRAPPAPPDPAAPAALSAAAVAPAPGVSRYKFKDHDVPLKQHWKASSLSKSKRIKDIADKMNLAITSVASAAKRMKLTM
jgi:hypothetical protein